MSRKHAITSLMLVVLAWLLFRWMGLIGPLPAPAFTQTEIQLLYLALGLITFWGALRWMIKNDDHGGPSG